jgi:hypothetical protein
MLFLPNGYLFIVALEYFLPDFWRLNFFWRFHYMLEDNKLLAITAYHEIEMSIQFFLFHNVSENISDQHLIDH